MLSSHYNIATEGIRAGHSAQATLGVGYYTQIIVTQPPSSGSSGGGGFYTPQEEKRIPVNPLFGVIRVEFYGKEESFAFYPIHNIPDIQIEVRKFKYTIDKATNAIINVTLVSSTKHLVSTPTITVKDKNYDSTERVEQPRILVEHPKHIKQT